MSSKPKMRWQALRRGRPGRRFQDRYTASRGADRGNFWSRLARIGLAALAIAVGIVLVFIPGPAVLFFAIAGALLASESRMVARFMDWNEVWIRKAVTWVARQWARRSLPGKITVCVVTGAMAAGAAYAAYRVTFR